MYPHDVIHVYDVSPPDVIHLSVQNCHVYMELDVHIYDDVHASMLDGI